MEGDTIEFDVLSLVAVHQSVPATQGKAEAGKRKLFKALCHIGIRRIGSVPGYSMINFLTRFKCPITGTKKE